MTPGINAAKKAGIAFKIHQYTHDPSCDSYGEEAAEKLNVPAEQVYKTLVVETEDGSLAVGVVQVTAMLNLKSMAKALGSKKAAMADKNKVMRTTGYVLGGVSPLGQKKRLPTVIDASAGDFTTIFVSGGKRGIDIELAPADLAKATGAHFAEIGK